MARARHPRELGYRPLYTVVAEVGGGWRVRGRRGRRGRGGFPDRETAVVHAVGLAAHHVVAQVRVFDADGNVLSDEARFDPERRRAAQAFLEEYLAPFRDLSYAKSVLEREEYVENCDLRIGEDVVRLTVVVHEGQAWDEIYVSGSVWDEPLGPRIAELSFVLGA